MLGQWTRLAWLAIVGRYLAMVIQLALNQLAFSICLRTRTIRASYLAGSVVDGGSSDRAITS